MAKRRRRADKGSSLFRQLLYILFVLVLTLAALLLERMAEEDGTTPDTPGDTVELPDTTGSWYQVYFTQPVNSNDPALQVNSTTENALVTLLDNAQRTIDAAVFELDSPAITSALVRAAQRGVQVRMVLDDEHAIEDPGSTVQQIFDAGIQTRSDERSALMHDKYFIVDGAAVWTGSTNVTRNGFYNNNNNALLIRSTKLAQNYQEDFEEMFTDGAFNNTDDTRGVPNRILSIDGTQIETFFSPDDRTEVQGRILNLLNTAQSSIRVMAFSFTLDELAETMIRRQQESRVMVEGVFETTGSLQGAMPKLACAGANVRQDGNPSIMHHKVIIIDEKIVIVGSFNFSKNAIENNSENLLIIHNADIAAAYTREFRARFAEGRVPPPGDISC